MSLLIFLLADILNLVCKQAAWKCSPLLRKWCEGPSRTLVFLPTVCWMVTPWGQVGWLEPAKSDPSAGANGYAGKGTFLSTVTCRVPPYFFFFFWSTNWNIEYVLLQVFQEVHNAEKEFFWPQRRMWGCSCTAGKMQLMLLLTLIWVLFWRHFYKMWVTSHLFLSSDLPTVPLFYQKYFSWCTCPSPQLLKSSNGSTFYVPVENLNSKSSSKVLHFGWIFFLI